MDTTIKADGVLVGDEIDALSYGRSSPHGVVIGREQDGDTMVLRIVCAGRDRWIQRYGVARDVCVYERRPCDPRPTGWCHTHAQWHRHCSGEPAKIAGEMLYFRRA